MIDHLINVDNFAAVVIRDRVAKILKCEFNNQLNIYKNADCRDLKVFAERRTPVDGRSETAYIGISLWKGKYGNKQQDYKDGIYSIVLDFIASSPTKGAVSGDTIANIRAQRLYALVEYILEHPVYNTLDFDPPFILHTELKEFQVLKFDDDGRSESAGIAQLQAVFEVRCGQQAQLLAGKLAAGSDTTVKLEETELGYEYVMTF